MSEVNAPVVTIDGPSGSGKGTVARRLSTRLGWHLLDSGALYRLTGIAADRQGIALDNEAACAEVAANLDVRFDVNDDGSECIRLAGEDVTRIVRHEDSGALASQVALLPAVRDALKGRQLAFRAAPGLVADGRDMGTVVFPDAPVKIFLEASAEERARRRMAQMADLGLCEAGDDGKFRAIFHEIKARDDRDRNREVAPLRPADDAIVIDTSELDIENVMDRVNDLVRMFG